MIGRERRFAGQANHLHVKAAGFVFVDVRFRRRAFGRFGFAAAVIVTTIAAVAVAAIPTRCVRRRRRVVCYRRQVCLLGSGLDFGEGRPCVRKVSLQHRAPIDLIGSDWRFIDDILASIDNILDFTFDLLLRWFGLIRLRGFFWPCCVPFVRCVRRVGPGASIGDVNLHGDFELDGVATELRHKFGLLR